MLHEKLASHPPPNAQYPVTHPQGEIVHLIPRETKFYDLFREQAANIHKAAQMLADLFENYQDVEKRVAEIKLAEHKGDQLTH